MTNNHDLKARIAAAKARQNDGDDTDTGTDGRAQIDGKAFGSAMRVGIELVSAIAIGTFVGYWIDQWLNTPPFAMIVFFFLGFAAGFLNLYKAQTKNYHKTGLGELTDTPKNGQKGSKEID